MAERTFRNGLQELINGYCMENASNTPDYVLTEYLIGCLHNFDIAVRERENWYGRPEKATGGGEW